MYQTRKFKVFIIFKRVSLNICKRKNIQNIFYHDIFVWTIVSNNAFIIYILE